MPRTVCIVMVKSPSAGAVKTRLVPPLSGRDAAGLAACFAQDMVISLRRIVSDIIIAYAPLDGRPALEELLPVNGLIWLEQQGEDLGARLEAAAAQAAMLGFGPVIITGTDSPTVPISFIETGISSLAAGESDIVLGPTEDGGYYVVGLRQFAGGLFQNVEWSTSLAYQQTVDNAGRFNLRTLELPRWYDVDTFSDLLYLRDEIFTSEEARRRAPATYQWLLEHDSQLSTVV